MSTRTLLKMGFMKAFVCLNQPMSVLWIWIWIRIHIRGTSRIQIRILVSLLWIWIWIRFYIRGTSRIQIQIRIRITVIRIRKTVLYIIQVFSMRLRSSVNKS